jgi:aminoglycoside phosphotransferase (APT) family kinase protein
VTLASHGYRSLSTGNVARYLADQGVLHSDAGDAIVDVLSGGVSADVFAVRTTRGSWVVKQALPQLRVAQQWYAAQQRIITEAQALKLAAQILPDRVPPVRLADQENFVVVQQMAPASFTNWREALLAGGDGQEMETAAALGSALACLHSSTFGDNGALADQFGSTKALVDLRIDPFHRAAAAALPAAADRLRELADDLLREPQCLVHGDFSPKNILARGADLWILDWEVAHLGNPVFDVAFLTAHLVCKAVHCPKRSSLYRSCAEAFYDTYCQAAPPGRRPQGAQVAAHTAALVLARTDGKSPAPYLDSAQRARARQLAQSWLLGSATELTDIWGQLQ